MASKVLVVGPGFVGREIIDLLLAESKYEVTALVRREAALEDLGEDGKAQHTQTGFAAAKMADLSLGVNAVLGDLDDTSLIRQLTSRSDIVFHTAGADHLASAQAILAGIEQRASEGRSSHLPSSRKWKEY